jgi:hypothetical protein
MRYQDAAAISVSILHVVSQSDFRLPVVVFIFQVGKLKFYKFKQSGKKTCPCSKTPELPAGV